MKKTIIFIFLVYSLIDCSKSKNNKLSIITKPNFNVEKIVVINNADISSTYFKAKITNPNDTTIVFLDNSIIEYVGGMKKPTKTGFYLRNIENDSLITLGIDNYYFYEVGAKRTGYCFIGAANLKYSYNEKDTLLLKKSLTNYVLEYNGKKLDLNKIAKTKYISQYYYDEFIKRKNNFIPFRDSLSISIPKNIKIKYVDNMPTTKEQWDAL